MLETHNDLDRTLQDSAARTRLLRSLAEPIHLELRTIVRDGQELRDLAQEVFVTLLEHDARALRRWDPAKGRNLVSFVRMIARRRAIRLIYRRRQVTALTEADHDDGQAEQQLQSRAQLRTLCLDLLRPRDQPLFELLFVHELEPAEVALRLGISRGAVNAWAYRIRKRALGLEAHRPVPGVGTSVPSQAR